MFIKERSLPQQQSHFQTAWTLTRSSSRTACSWTIIACFMINYKFITSLKLIQAQWEIQHLRKKFLFNVIDTHVDFLQTGSYILEGNKKLFLLS